MTPWQCRHATRLLKQGGVIAYPTETVMGLGCDPLNQHAVERILTIKVRAWDQGLLLIAANIGQLLPYIVPLAASRMKAIQATWPGPVTWLLPASPLVPRWIRGRHATVAVRVSSHAAARALCQQFGRPLVSTSANRSGLPPSQRHLQIRRRLGAKIDYVVPMNAGPYRRASKIRDGRSGAIIRAG